jgi:hypothetical protein
MKKITLAQVAKVAMRVQPPYVLGTKVLIDRVAGELGVTVKQLAPQLIEWHQKGELRLARIDLSSAFDRVQGALKRSWVPQPGMKTGAAGWDAIDRASFG